MWRTYVFCNALVHATIAGLKGLRAGAKLGRGLVLEQTVILLRLLTAVTDYLGAPYAELILCQVIGAAIMGLATEIVYTTVLGLVAGAAGG